MASSANRVIVKVRRAGAVISRAAESGPQRRIDPDLWPRMHAIVREHDLPSACHDALEDAVQTLMDRDCLALEALHAQPEGLSRSLTYESTRLSEPYEPYAEQPRTDWIEVELLDSAGQPVQGAIFELVSPTGERIRGTTNGQGLWYAKRLEPGSYTIRFTTHEVNRVD